MPSNKNANRLYMSYYTIFYVFLSQNEKEKAGTFIHRHHCLMNARAGLNSNGSARLERYWCDAGASIGNPAYALDSAVFIT